MKSFSRYKGKRVIYTTRQQALRRRLAAMLCVCMLLPYGAGIARAMPESFAVCEHHPVHTADCGYVEAADGHACGHVHNESCYQIGRAHV